MGFYSSFWLLFVRESTVFFRYRNAQHQTDADGQRNGYLKGADAVGKGQRIVALYKIVGGVVDARTGHQREDAGQQEHRYRHFNHNGKHAVSRVRGMTASREAAALSAPSITASS